MSNHIDHQSNVDTIYQAVEEVSALLSALEAQIRLGLTQGQPELEFPQMPESDESDWMLEETAFLSHWL